MRKSFTINQTLTALPCSHKAHCLHAVCDHALDLSSYI
ncbi:hypothetical protein ELY25_09435 [Vreelandella populi]|nr:hypothetical protein ELY25_09435 [Halomonas populi]